MRANGMVGVGFPLLAGALLLAGCACPPVTERVVVGESLQTSCPGVWRTRLIRRLEPVGESCVIRNRPICVTTPGDRYYNPATRTWERPWPYGPYGTANWW